MTSKFPDAKIIGTVAVTHSDFADDTIWEDCYALQCDGGCMEPIIMDGGRAICDPNRRPCNGDIAVIELENGNRIVKRLVMMPPPDMLNLAAGSNVMALVMIEQINPYRGYTIAADKIVSVHKVIGVTEPGCDVVTPVDGNSKILVAS
jgi:hypothetical protein